MSRMPHHVAVAALVLCVISGTVSASDPVAQMAGMASKDAFASHEHSPALLGFMSNPDKKYRDCLSYTSDPANERDCVQCH